MWSAFQEDPAVALLDRDWNQPVLEAGPAHAQAGIGRVGRAVSRAYQMQAPDIKKLSRAPVELHRHVRAAVEVRVDAPVVSHGERRLGLSPHLDLESHAVAALGE